MSKEQIKIKLFVLKADEFEKQVNNWLSQHPNIEILHRYVNNDWVSHTGVSEACNGLKTNHIYRGFIWRFDNAI